MSVLAHHERAVVVTGDVTIDWNIACAPFDKGGAESWIEERSGTRAYWQRGGAALLADLVAAIGARLQQKGQAALSVRQTAAPREQVVPEDPRFHHTYKQWRLFPYDSSRWPAHPAVWRLAEWLGMSRGPANPAHNGWAQVVDDTPDPALIVLGDATLGFREQPELWPLALQPTKQSANPPWILLKMSRPVAQGALWEHLHRNLAERLIVVTTIDDLRQTEVQISRELSWERTAQDLAWELVYNPRINTLSHCAHLVVSFGAAGAMLLSRGAGSTGRAAQSRLFFDPKVIEGMWEAEHPGAMSGHTTCLTAALTHQLLAAGEQPDIDQAVQGGLAALRTLHQDGYGSHSAPAGGASPVVFPIDLIADELLANRRPFSVAAVRDPARSILPAADGLLASSSGRLWTILEDRYTDSLDQVAQQIVLRGADVALQDVPLGRFGSLLTVDRQEIEGYRSLRSVVGEYCRQANPTRPLSIAVFGAPGSGKSFGVTQVASSLLPGQIEKLTFNLSQFDSAHQLLDAFHQVRDVALTGRIPLVFWDEFDTALENQPLGWLRHFLAPMQDGVFQEGQILHPIGRSIFVFAGGTCERMATFDRGTEGAFRAAKGPDFVSRLKGFVDVVGPNPRNRDLIADRYSVIRRAILLRFLLQSYAPHIFHRVEGVSTPQIDSGVLRAFLEIPFYKHGARSLESIVSTSALTGKSQFERSALPTEAQLDIHVDGRRFLSLVQRLELDGALLERLAEASHEIYRASAQARRGAPVGAYADLSEAVKEQNRQVVRDIPAKLAYAGYVMRPARSDEPSFDFPAGDRERLAELEHQRWVKTRIAAGWRYGPQTDPAQMTHAALLPWQTLPAREMAERYSAQEQAALGSVELPVSEKEKTGDLIDGIPRILARAGYTLLKVREDATGG